MEIRIAGIQKESCVDGEGLRYVVFMQGCKRNCKGCHNPNTHDLNGGIIVDTSDIIAEIKKNPLLQGVTLSGGEPLLQIAPAAEIASAAKAMGLNVWLYTGYRLEDIPPDADELLKSVDAVVDGEYIEPQRDLTLAFRGSKNQRVICLNKA